MQDSNEPKNKKGRPRSIKTKQDWHERLRNIRIGKKGTEDSEKPDYSTMAYAIFDENLYLMGEREFSPSKVTLISYLQLGYIKLFCYCKRMFIILLLTQKIKFSFFVVLTSIHNLIIAL